MKKKLISILLTFILLLYFVLRINTIKQIDSYSDYFFTEFSKSKEIQIKKYLSKNIKPEETYSIIAKHSQAISNFDYKNTKPNINVMLNKATVDVSWHLTIIFEKQKNDWCISEFKEYTDN